MVTGSTGCNEFTATYAVSGDLLAIGPIAATEALCDNTVVQQDVTMLEALRSSTGYSMSGHALRLTDANGQTQLSARRAPTG